MPAAELAELNAAALERHKAQMNARKAVEPVRPAVQKTAYQQVSAQSSPAQPSPAQPTSAQPTPAQPAEEEVKAKPSIKLRQGGFTTKLQGKVDEKNLVVEKKEPIELNQEVLEKLWGDYAESVKAEDEKLYRVLKEQRLVFVDQNNFNILLANLYQKDELDPHRIRILTALRKESGHDFLQWNFVVERHAVEKVAYQPREKYEEMYKRNPNIAKLRALFQDIDF